MVKKRLSRRTCFARVKDVRNETADGAGEEIGQITAILPPSAQSLCVVLLHVLKRSERWKSVARNRTRLSRVRFARLRRTGG